MAATKWNRKLKCFYSKLFRNRYTLHAYANMSSINYKKLFIKNCFQCWIFVVNAFECAVLWRLWNWAIIMMRVRMRCYNDHWSYYSNPWKNDGFHLRESRVESGVWWAANRHPLECDLKFPAVDRVEPVIEIVAVMICLKVREKHHIAISRCAPCQRLRLLPIPTVGQ